ncbi:MAG: fasciclin domain-containing protein [Cyclobacteriaceae bacterium]|nr:fasciclin domain-containing protein [Cyclobacteriaceae bacterium]
MKKLFDSSFLTRVLAIALALSFTLSSCKDDDNDVAPTQSIVALAQASPSLSTLVSALTKYPDLVSTLSGSGTFTVFAPTNSAFETLLTAIGQTSLDDIPESVLKSVLEYHVVSTAAVLSTQLSNGEVTTVGGENVSVNITSGVKLNSTVNVTTADIRATNGVIHLIDAVLVPPTVLPIVGTIVAPAYFNKNFSTLVSAVIQAGLLPTLLSTSNELTLFAPTNAAFNAAGITALPSNTTEGNALLTSILAYHVVAGEYEVKAADIANGPSSAITFGGSRIYLSKGTTGVFINGTTQVTTTDIQGSNGIVHVINRALIPPTQTIAEIVVANTSAPSPQFTQLLAALARTDGQGEDDLLAAVSASTGELTVFAPTDAAFQALYTSLQVANVNEIPLETLIAVLKKHVVGVRRFSTDLVSGAVPTLNGNVTVNTTALTVAGGSGDPANLVATLLNIQAKNGVIHVIDKVLLP